MIQKIISGGQTGADSGGLMAAKILGISTGGFAPKNFYTEDGPNYDLKHIYGLTETNGGYTKRTEINIDISDGTVIFSPITHSPGTVLTIKMCELLNRPYLLNPKNAFEFIDFISKHNINILNIAGNRESKFIGIQQTTCDFIVEALKPFYNI